MAWGQVLSNRKKLHGKDGSAWVADLRSVEYPNKAFKGTLALISLIDPFGVTA